MPLKSLPLIYVFWWEASQTLSCQTELHSQAMLSENQNPGKNLNMLNLRLWQLFIIKTNLFRSQLLLLCYSYTTSCLHRLTEQYAKNVSKGKSLTNSFYLRDTDKNTKSGICEHPLYCCSGETRDGQMTSTMRSSCNGLEESNMETSIPSQCERINVPESVGLWPACHLACSDSFRGVVHSFAESDIKNHVLHHLSQKVTVECIYVVSQILFLQKSLTFYTFQRGLCTMLQLLWGCSYW